MTSALGPGVDFPGVVFTLHVDVPYGMIHFAQKSGRAGRAGEDVDSVVIVEEGKAERQLAGGMRGVDEAVMCDFISTKGCRRKVVGLYLDNKEVECGQDAITANYDRCGEGVAALERHYTRAARERQTFEETLDEVSDGCVFCFIKPTGESGVS